MKTLIIGAGAIGGYFGGRLLEAGKDVTFLVRPGRAGRLAQMGLVIQSPLGDLPIHNPPTVQADALHKTFDLILLSCKSYDLEDAITSFASAVGPETMILPLLNGISHLDRLERQFGAQAVLGGQCLISSTMDAAGRIIHLNDLHSLSFGERDGTASPRAHLIEAEFAEAKFDAHLSETILQDMWEKWVFIATAAGITCLMRASIGDIIKAGGGGLAVQLLDECAAIAGEQGFAPRPAAFERILAMFKTAGSPVTASMLRDIEANSRTEFEHVLGDLMRRGAATEQGFSILRTAYLHLAAYEARRTRMQGANST
jgi:2-dehydropantoate 2-reductase